MLIDQLHWSVFLTSCPSVLKKESFSYPYQVIHNVCVMRIHITIYHRQGQLVTPRMRLLRLQLTLTSLNLNMSPGLFTTDKKATSIDKNLITVYVADEQCGDHWPHKETMDWFGSSHRGVNDPPWDMWCSRWCSQLLGDVGWVSHKW